MPFREVSIMDQRILFVARATEEGANIRGLCREHGISPTTGYEWLRRAKELGRSGLADRSRRPHHSPSATAEALVREVLEVRREHPYWGGRKIHHVLRQRGRKGVPHPNTITGILHRHGLISPEASEQHRPFCRFERAKPNELWQMDFKGHFPVGAGRCHPLTVVDDHSRYAVTLRACADEARGCVQPALERTFRRYGLPEGILVDNGPPWGTSSRHRHTRLTAWLMRLGIEPIHGRPFHPQTRGKNERFNGTVKREVLDRGGFQSLAGLQARFDRWRQLYNHVRPHEGIDNVPPACRFQPSARRFPRELAEPEYGSDCIIRRVQEDGRISFQGRPRFISGAFAGHPIGLRPTNQDGLFHVLFCRFHVADLDIAVPENHDF